MICYLCEKELLESDELNDDHIPPNGFFPSPNPPGIRKLRTHKACNSSYQFDEEYALRMMAVTSAGWDESAKVVGQKILRSITHPRGIGFSKRLIRETGPAKNILRNAPDVIANFPTTKIDPERMGRVLQKIVKGLYFSEFNKTLKADNLQVNLDGVLYGQFGEMSGLDLVFIGTTGQEEFKYRRELGEGGKYELLFYNVHHFTIPLSAIVEL